MTTLTETCERTWKVEVPAALTKSSRDRDSYRQHRCGQAAGHTDGPCKCRYCGGTR